MLEHVYKEYAGYNLLDFLGHSNFLLSCLLSNGRNRLEGGHARNQPPILVYEVCASDLPRGARGSESTSRSLNERFVPMYSKASL